jgi:DHA2 family methylenomycin A resistance protein-like MFS transporter
MTTTTAQKSALLAGLLGFFVVTLDALVVNVALPAMGRDLGGGMAGLQWVVDGYTLMFAALLLSAGVYSDRVGARRAYAIGLAVFVTASVACGLAPGLGVLVVARLVQGAGAAVVMPASLALIREAYPDQARRGRAIAIWAVGGAVGSAAGPVLGGLLSLASWRMIFFVNVPVCAAALLLLTRLARSPRRAVPFDWTGQVAAVLAMGALTFGLIEGGAEGFGAGPVLGALAVAVLAMGVFVAAQALGAHPMVPLGLLRFRTVPVTLAVGFALNVGFYGSVFLLSLYLQQERGWSALETGLAFLPMTALVAACNLAAARLAERYGPRLPIIVGQSLMAAGLLILYAGAAQAPTVWLAVLMIPVGVGGGIAVPALTALLLDSLPAERAGMASGVLNTCRQVGGALAVAVFGALVARRTGFAHGLRVSVLAAAVLVLATATASVLLRTPEQA